MGQIIFFYLSELQTRAKVNLSFFKTARFSWFFIKNKYRASKLQHLTVA